MNDNEVQAQPPIETVGLRVTDAPNASAGLAGVAAAMADAYEEMGVVRSFQTLLKVNQADGFDCPGCAWPDPQGKRSFAEFCENGAKAVAEEATTKRIDRDFFVRHSVAELSRQADHWLGKQGRLTEPMVLRAGATHYAPISWDDAFQLIASELNALSSPDEAIFYTSGRTSNEAAFLYQLFVRQFGTNNLPDCSNMCHESSGYGLSQTIGVGKGTVSLEDIEHADTIFVIGQNPGTNHPRMLSSLQRAVSRGCRVVSINPLVEAGLQAFKHPQTVRGILGTGTSLAQLFVRVRINGDVALLKGVLKELLAAEDAAPGTVFDHAFIAEHTDGFEAFADDLRATSWDTIIAGSGVTRETIAQVAELARTAERLICCWAMGLTQHKNAVGNIQEIVNLLLLRGMIGKPGAGACPVRGHSNVQGDRTMGIFERMPAAFLDRLSAEFAFDPPRRHGYDTVAAIHAMLAGRATVFVGMGGNFLSATPDTEQTAKALRNCRLTVQVSTKLNRSHLVTGKTALILPCLGRTERDVQASGPQFVTVEDSMSMVHMSRGNLEPASPYLLSEPAIVAGIASTALVGRSQVPWQRLVEDYDRIRDHIEKVVPGFEDFNRRVHQPDGFLLPNGARDRQFKTKVGKARFTVHAIPPDPLGPGQFLMMTIRSHDQYNTTIYGLDDRYRGISNGRRVIFMNADDIADAKLKPGDYVDITSHFAGTERTVTQFAVVSYDIPPRCTATYFPEANALVPLESVADGSNTPTSKSVVISLRKFAGE
jgi:molybdopterin-dependent oxidoreductase alpha subunit